MTSRSDQSGPKTVLDESRAPADPLELFRLWYRDAENTAMALPNAMTLATATRAGKPSARLVLLKGLDEGGFVFFTNYESRKSQELEENPQAALVFYWSALDRQVRIEGRVERIAPEESDAYFATRPAGSRISATISPQSREIPNRGFLEKQAKELVARYPSGEVPRPPYWGGYRLAADVIEFWVSRPDRLHDRLCYKRTPEGIWQLMRLAP
jgi:pyridoxamine 5'-phosphate oxidase